MTNLEARLGLKKLGVDGAKAPAAAPCSIDAKQAITPGPVRTGITEVRADIKALETRLTLQPGGIVAVSAVALGLILANAPVVEAGDGGYNHYRRPPYQGGLIDSYDRYDPQLYRRLYPDRVPNNYDYEPSPPAASGLPPRCLYTCPGGPLDPARH